MNMRRLPEFIISSSLVRKRPSVDLMTFLLFRHHISDMMGKRDGCPTQARKQKKIFLTTRSQHLVKPLRPYLKHENSHLSGSLSRSVLAALASLLQRENMTIITSKIHSAPEEDKELGSKAQGRNEGRAQFPGLDLDFFPHDFLAFSPL